MGPTVKRIELRPDKSLIDSNFDGYKLSLDSLPLYEQEIDGVHEVKLTEDLYSYQHIKSFGLHNHLFRDAWNENHVYYANQKWSLLAVTSEQIGQNFVVSKPREVFKIPHKADPVLGAYNVTLQFVSAEYAVLSDGVGTLNLLHSDDRSADASWQNHFSNECLSGKPFLLLHAIFSGSSTLNCLLLHIEERVNVKNFESDIKSPFVNILEWITIQSDETGTWSIERVRSLAGSSSIDYGALEPSGLGLGIVSESKFRFITDSSKGLETVNADTELDKSVTTGKTPTYAWTQTADRVILWFKLAEGVTKADVEFKMLPSHLLFRLKSGNVILDGPLFSSIDVENSTWTRLDNQIQVTLSKDHSGLMWSEVVKGDASGEEVLDTALMASIQQRLAHLTSDQLNPDSQGQQLGSMNPQQLEECDSFPVDSYVFARFSGESHKVTNEVCLSSHQWLFSPPSQPNQMPAFCVRHDVDGLLWQPAAELNEAAEPLGSDAEPNWSCRHVATFNALGYVLASKQDRKFLSCSPGNGFVALSDLRRHLYLYFQPSPLESDLRNRKTGRRVAAVAKQQVLALETEEILGLQVNDHCVFVLSTNKLFVVRIRSTTADND